MCRQFSRLSYRLIQWIADLALCMQEQCRGDKGQSETATGIWARALGCHSLPGSGHHKPPSPSSLPSSLPAGPEPNSPSNSWELPPPPGLPPPFEPPPFSSEPPPSRPGQKLLVCGSKQLIDCGSALSELCISGNSLCKFSMNDSFQSREFSSVLGSDTRNLSARLLDLLRQQTMRPQTLSQH